MLSPPLRGEAVDLSLRGELRYGLELARLASAPEFLRPVRRPDAPPVLLVPGFMAGDQSLAALRGWLRRRGSETATGGIRFNVDCGERIMGRLEASLRRLAGRTGRRVVVIGQSRGGELGRVLAVRAPETIESLVMLGAPVREPLSVGPRVLGAVRYIARLGDLGVPGMFSTRCADGPCCSAYREDLRAPLPPEVDVVSIYSRSDGIVSWEACIDPGARNVEVDSSHTGMSVNRQVFRVLNEIMVQEPR